MKGTLLKKIELENPEHKYAATADCWLEKYWLVDTNLALDAAWQRFGDYDGRSPANITLEELIEQEFLDAREVDAAITEWLRLPWVISRGVENQGYPGGTLFSRSVTIVLDVIARVGTLVTARETLCDLLPVIFEWACESPCCRRSDGWVQRALLDAAVRLPQRRGRYVDLYRERLETTEQGNQCYFTAVYMRADPDNSGVAEYLHRLARNRRRKRRATLAEYSQAEQDHIAKRFDEETGWMFCHLFHIYHHGLYSSKRDGFYTPWRSSDPDVTAQLRILWDDTSARVARFCKAQNVFAPF